MDCFSAYHEMLLCTIHWMLSDTEKPRLAAVHYRNSRLLFIFIKYNFSFRVPLSGKLG